MSQRRWGAEWKFSMTAKSKCTLSLCPLPPTTATPSCFPVAPLPGSFCYLYCHSMTSHCPEGAPRFSPAPQHPSDTVDTVVRAEHVTVSLSIVQDPQVPITRSPATHCCHPLIVTHRRNTAVFCLLCCLSHPCCHLYTFTLLL